MKPAYSSEIVVGEGEYLYREGSDLIRMSIVLLARVCHRVLGVRIRLSHIIGLLMCSVVCCSDPYPDTGMRLPFTTS